MTRTLLHATTIAIDGTGVIIIGPPGSGKSSLALSLIDQPGFGTGDVPLRARLVADDQTALKLEGGTLIASAPAALAGLLEIRGQGLVRVDAAEAVALVLAVLIGHAASIERLPDDPYTELLGVRLACIRIDAASPSAPARVRAALVSCRRNAWGREI